MGLLVDYYVGLRAPTIRDTVPCLSTDIDAASSGTVPGTGRSLLASRYGTVPVPYLADRYNPSTTISRTYYPDRLLHITF